VKRMNEEINKALKTPDVASKLAAQGITVVGGTPEAAHKFVDNQMNIWAKVVKDNNIKAD
ncbi:MAG: tripartite tricarboxylate transporter substrate-binding protein, partial [Casimicrobiaceae bacterium]